MRTLAIVNALELATAYVAARYGVRLDADTLLLQVGQVASDVEAYWPARDYVFITAWNPASEPRPESANQAADTLLAARLDELGVDRHPAWAVSPDGQWQEPGWLIADIDDASANRLGASFGQAAILAWDFGQPVRVRMLMPRPALTHAAASSTSLVATCVDWFGEPPETVVTA